MRAEREQKVWAFADQIASSLTNFLPGFYAAHVLVPRDFAVFGLLQVGYVLALGVTRSLFSNVAMVSDFAKVPTRRHRGAIDAVAAVAALSCLAATVVLGLATDAPTWAVAFAITGIGMALVQDALRFASIATHHAGDALLNDVVWLVAVAMLLPLTRHFEPGASVWIIAGVWAWSALGGLLVGTLTTRWRPSPGRGWWFVRDNPRLSGSFLAGWSLNQGSATVAVYTIPEFREWRACRLRESGRPP